MSNFKLLTYEKEQPIAFPPGAGTGEMGNKFLVIGNHINSQL
jgi:hypothetical protein